MSYRLILLGLLAEQPRYGYELKQTIEQRSFAEYVRLSGGGLYYNLRKLCEEGHIAEQAVEHEGNYPERHTYRITAQGRAYFLQLLRGTLDDVEGRRHYDPLDAALAFGGVLPAAEVIVRLQHQADQLRPTLLQLQAIQALQTALPQYMDLYNTLILEHAVHSLTGTIRWLEIMIARIGTTAATDPARLTCGGDPPRPARPMPEASAQVVALYESVFNNIAAGGYQKLGEAEAAYGRSLAEAWQEYEAQLRATGPAGERAQQEREAYARRVAAGWRAYEALIRAEQTTALAALTSTAQALQRALAQVAGASSTDTRHEAHEGHEGGEP